MKSNFKSPNITRFSYFKFGSLWNIQRAIALAVGTVQSGFMVLMVLLVLNFAGNESVLGKIEFGAALFSAITTYVAGRVSMPKHRGKMMYFAATSLLIGGIALSLLVTNNNQFINLVSFSFLGVIIMKISQVISDPIILTSHSATFLSSIEKSSFNEEKDSFSYIMDHEYFLNAGRILGGIIFLILVKFANDTIALRYSFIIFGAIMFVAASMVTKLNKTGSPGKRAIENID